MAVDVARYFYKGGLNCAESTLRCLIEEGIIDPPAELGLPPGRERTVSGPFPVSASRKKCASSRSLLLCFGSREPSAAAVREFLRRFEETFGSLTCRELQAVYVKEHALKSEGMYRSCTAFVEKAVELAQDILGRASLA